MKILFLLLLSVFSYTRCFSQNRNERWYPVTLMVGTTILTTLDNHWYRPNNFLIQIPYLLRGDIETDKLFLTIEPNLSVVNINKKLKIRKDEFEVGVLFGLKQVHQLKKFSISTEPFFGFITITNYDDKQVGGPNFNLGFDIGFAYKFKEVTLSYDFRYRHLSNAGITLPNAGIDNLLMFIGVTKSQYKNKKK